MPKLICDKGARAIQWTSVDKKINFSLSLIYSVKINSNLSWAQVQNIKLKLLENSHRRKSLGSRARQRYLGLDTKNNL